MTTGDNYAGRYFVMRKGYDPIPQDLDLMAELVYFNHWSRRLNPFQRIAEGDTLYLLDHERRSLAVELRVNYLIKTGYETVQDGMDQLRAVYGIVEPDEGWPGYAPAPGPGYLLAYGLDVIGPLDIPFGFRWDILGGRHGYISVDSFASSDQIDAALRDEVLEQLPQPGKQPLARAERCDTKAVINDEILSRAPRRPSFAVMQEIRTESGGVCENEGCSRKAEHFDHDVPWSKGGNSDYANIRHLCAACNLSKSDRMPEDHSPDQMWFRINCHDIDGEVMTFGPDSTAFEVHTMNSVYFTVFSGESTIAWKRGSREIFSCVTPSNGGLQVENDVQILRLPGLLRTSPVQSTKTLPAAEALSLIGLTLGVEIESIREDATV